MKKLTLTVLILSVISATAVAGPCGAGIILEIMEGGWGEPSRVRVELISYRAQDPSFGGSCQPWLRGKSTLFPPNIGTVAPTVDDRLPRCSLTPENNVKIVGVSTSQITGLAGAADILHRALGDRSVDAP